MATSGADLYEFADASFDLVLSYIVFQHIPNSIVSQYFREIRRVMASGGCFRFQVARIHLPGFVQPPDTDTFSMRSWSLDTLQAEFVGWTSATYEVIPVDATTDHIWVTAYK